MPHPVKASLAGWGLSRPRPASPMMLIPGQRRADSSTGSVARDRVQSIAMGLDADSLERLIPDDVVPEDTTGAETLRLHVERYDFAARHVRPGRLLDIACGVGYGTRILTDAADGRTRGLGLDISNAAISHANERYANEVTRYLCADAMDFESDEGFDTIVSIETLEHLPEPLRFVEHVAALLNPGGLFIASVPVTPSVDGNPHHLHDFTERSFRRVFGHLRLVAIASFEQDQHFSPGAVVTRREARMQHVRRNLPVWYLRHPGSLLRRVASTLRYGFRNKYLTVVWRSPA